MKIDEIKGFPKDLLKKKTLTLYKAFQIKDPDDEMQVNVSADLLAITEVAAVEQFLRTTSFLDFTDGILDDKIISFAVFELDMKDLLKKDLLLNGGEDYFQDDILFISIKDKIYDIKVGDKMVTTIKAEADDSGMLHLSHLEMEDISKSKK